MVPRRPHLLARGGLVEVNFYTVPAGVIGMQATSRTWARLDREDEPAPATRSLVSGEQVIRLYSCDHDDLDEIRAAAWGLVILRPGAVVPVEDDLVPRDEPTTTTDTRRRRGRSARRQRPR